MGVIAEELPKEIERVKEIIREYESLPDNSGMIAAILMKEDITKAQRALTIGDINSMFFMYEALKKWEL